MTWWDWLLQREPPFKLPLHVEVPPQTPQHAIATALELLHETIPNAPTLFSEVLVELIASAPQKTDDNYAKLIEASIRSILTFVDAVPRYQNDSPFSVAVRDVLDPRIIQDCILVFFWPQYRDGTKQITEAFDMRACELSGLSYSKENAQKIKLPKDYKGDPLDYLHGSPLLKLFQIKLPFAIPKQTYREHGIIISPSGSGKTQLLGAMIADFLDTDTPLIVLDPHGDLFENLRLRVDPSRLILLDPDTNPPQLNFLDFGNASETEILQSFTYLMSSLSGGLSDKQGALIPYLLRLLRKIPNATIVTILQLVTEQLKKGEQSRFQKYINQLDQLDQDFFEHQFLGSKMPETKQAIAWRLSAALASHAFREMFSATTNEFDASAAIRDRKVVLVKGSERSLGEQGLPVFLQFVVSQFFLAALRRAAIPPDQRHLAVIFADEASHIFNHQTTRILTECRKFGLGFIAATQLIEHIPTEVKAAIYGSTAIKIAGPVAATDAMLLAREMYTTADFIRSMKAVRGSHGEFAFHVSGVTDKAVKVTVPYGALEKRPILNTAPYVPTPKPPTQTQPPEPPAPKPPRQRIIPR